MVGSLNGYSLITLLYYNETNLKGSGFYLLPFLLLFSQLKK